jgi:hypothetical protein
MGMKEKIKSEKSNSIKTKVKGILKLVYEKEN